MIHYKTKLHGVSGSLRRMLDGEAQMTRDIRRVLKTEDLPRNVLAEIYAALVEVHHQKDFEWKRELFAQTMDKLGVLWIGGAAAAPPAAGFLPLSQSSSSTVADGVAGAGGGAHSSSAQMGYSSGELSSDVIRKNYSFGQPQQLQQGSSNLSAEVEDISGYTRYVIGKSPLKKSFTSSVPRTREEPGGGAGAGSGSGGLNQSGGNLDKLMQIYGQKGQAGASGQRVVLARNQERLRPLTVEPPPPGMSKPKLSA